MKIHLLYDKNGNVISAGFPTPPAGGVQSMFGPEPKEGQYAAEFEAPEEFTKVKRSEIGKRLHELLQVDIKSKPHRLIFKSK